jgi:hypothetical protein
VWVSGFFRQIFLARETPGPSEFSAGTAPGTCPKARGTSQVDVFSYPGPEDFFSLASLAAIHVSKRHSHTMTDGLASVEYSQPVFSPTLPVTYSQHSIPHCLPQEKHMILVQYPPPGKPVACCRVGTDVSHWLAPEKVPGTFLPLASKCPEKWPFVQTLPGSPTGL